MILSILAKSYLARVSESFINKKWEISDTTVLILESILLIILLCILFYLLQKRYQKKKEEERKNPFTIKKPSEIKKILEQALNERSKFEVSFSKKHKFSSNCSLVELKGKSIVLELPSNIVPTDQWNKRPVYVYFSLSGDKPGIRVYYYFESVVEYFFSKKTFHFIVIKIPGILELKQKKENILGLMPKTKILKR